MDRFRKFETADLIGFPLLDSIQSSRATRPSCTRPRRLREASGSGDENGIAHNQEKQPEHGITYIDVVPRV